MHPLGRGVVTAARALLCFLWLVPLACTGGRSPRTGETAPPRSASASSSSVAGGSAPVIGDYAARWEPSTGSLHVEARFATGAGALFGVERGAEPFADDIQVCADDDRDRCTRWSPVVRRGRSIEAAACGAGACRLRYRFLLRDAARKLDDVDIASEESDVIEAPPSTWLLAPGGAPREQRLRFRVTCPPGSRFVTGVFPSADVAGAWEISIDDLWTSPYTAFGPLKVRSIPVTGGTIQLALGPGALAVSEDDLARWVESSTAAVSAYYGRFPMPNALVLLVVSRGPWVGGGRTLSGGGGTVMVRIGERASPRAYREDWVLVHEMIHLTFPSVAREQDWAEEGIATYVEPFARVRAGLLAEDAAWLGLAEGLPNGLPRPGDEGLDRTRTWGRTYWGGALFWFLADVEIRKRTNNRFGLEHALRGINESGGSNASRWPLEEVLAAGDRATGVPVLRELYAAMATSPHPVDVDALMKSLGVELARGRVRFDDTAPLAGVRRAISRGEGAR